MASYKAEVTIPACHVDRDLLVAIEQWFANHLPTILPEVVGSSNDPSFEVSITDALGKEAFASVSEIAYPSLLDSTSEVRIDWRSARDSVARLHVSMDFDQSSFRFAKLTIETDGNNAREIAVVVKNAFDRLIEPHRTLAWLYHPFSGASIFAWFAAGMLLVIGLPLAMSNRAAGTGVILGGVVLTWYAATGWFVQPFVSFDTRSRRVRLSAWRWISLGLLGFLIFGTALPQARKWIFGF
jgi:hypothetical protein